MLSTLKGVNSICSRTLCNQHRKIAPISNIGNIYITRKLSNAPPNNNSNTPRDLKWRNDNFVRFGLSAFACSMIFTFTPFVVTETIDVQMYALMTAFSTATGGMAGFVARQLSARHLEDAQLWTTYTTRQKNLASVTFGISVLGWSTCIDNEYVFVNQYSV